MNDALNLADQLSEVRLQNELARIDQKRQAEIDAVNESVLSEEGKKAQLIASMPSMIRRPKKRKSRRQARKGICHY